MLLLSKTYNTNNMHYIINQNGKLGTFLIVTSFTLLKMWHEKLKSENVNVGIQHITYWLYLTSNASVISLILHILHSFVLGLLTLTYSAHVVTLQVFPQYKTKRPVVPMKEKTNSYRLCKMISAPLFLKILSYFKPVHW